MRPPIPVGFWQEVEEMVGPMRDAAHLPHGCSCGLLVSVLGVAGECEFFKGAHQVATPDTFRRYGREFDRLRLIPLLVEEYDFPAPTVGGLYEDDEWRIVGYQGFATLPRERPWSGEHVTAALNVLLRASRAVPGAATASWPKLCEQPWAMGGPWTALDEANIAYDHRIEIDSILSHLPEALSREQHVHGSAYQSHHFLIESQSRGILVDWADAAIGPTWVDGIDVLIGGLADGQVNLTMALMHPLFDGVHDEYVDAWLASRLGFFVDRARRPLGSAHPALNQIFGWYAGATHAWLAQRRGWHP